MKILFIAMSDSIHTARWINQIASLGWDIHVFPSLDHGITHPLLKNATIYHTFYGKQIKNNTATNKGIPLRSQKLARLGIKIVHQFYPNYRIDRLEKIIQTLKPDIIHSLEMQSAGYITYEIKKRYPMLFPPWIVSNWGSDIYLFGQLETHKKKIREVLSSCEYYSCECNRDIELAKKFGFKGTVLPVLPNAGGFNIKRIVKFRQAGKISKRRIIMLKGYQGWTGRSLMGIAALSHCINLLKGYTLFIYSAKEDSGVPLAANLLSNKSGIKVVILPLDTPHERILELHGQARISIGLSISDGISTSLLEAMAMGSFPIQSCTSCANEWIIDGKTGILVPPESPEIIAKAITLALTNDELVDSAAEKNYRVVEKKLNQKIINPKIVKLYKDIVRNKK